MSTIRQQVAAQIIETMRAADDAGLDPFNAARQSYPGTPEMVLGECFAEMDDAKTEAWGRTIEKTIDGEVIRAALAKGGSE